MGNLLATFTTNDAPTKDAPTTTYSVNKSTKFVAWNWSKMLLLTGYIRENNHHLDVIICDDVISIISTYYALQQHIIYYVNYKNELHSVDLENIAKKANTKIKYNWNEKDNSPGPSDPICFNKNVQFIDNDKYFNVIFRTGYHVHYSYGDRLIAYSGGRCNALIWNVNDVNLENVVNVELPKNPLFDKNYTPNFSKHTPYGQSLIFSNQQQSLFTIGCTRHKSSFFKLSFDEYIIDNTKTNYKHYTDNIHIEWKWSNMK
eukprot:80170_1